MERQMWESPNKKWRIFWRLDRQTMYIENEYTAQMAHILDDGRVVYDFPERLPKYVKQAAQRIAKKVLGAVS